MSAGFAENLDQEIGGPVDDLWVSCEIGLCVDKTGQRDNAGHLVQRTQLILNDSKAGEESDAGSLLGGFEITFRGDFSEIFFVTNYGKASGNVE